LYVAYIKPKQHAHTHGFDAAAGGRSAATLTGQKNKCSHRGNGAGVKKIKKLKKMHAQKRTKKQ
jgi:hypothetical protein